MNIIRFFFFKKFLNGSICNVGGDSFCPKLGFYTHFTEFFAFKKFTCIVFGIAFIIDKVKLNQFFNCLVNIVCIVLAQQLCSDFLLRMVTVIETVQRTVKSTARACRLLKGSKLLLIYFISGD